MTGHQLGYDTNYQRGDTRTVVSQGWEIRQMWLGSEDQHWNVVGQTWKGTR